MDKQKLIKQLFFSKVADALGLEKTTELLKEATDAINRINLGQEIPISDVRVHLSEFHDEHVEVLSEFLKLTTIDHPEYPEDRQALEYALRILKLVKRD